MIRGAWCRACKSSQYQCNCISTSFLGLYTPALFKTFATMGTIELTGFETTDTNAFGQFLRASDERVNVRSFEPVQMLDEDSREMRMRMGE